MLGYDATVRNTGHTDGSIVAVAFTGVGANYAERGLESVTISDGRATYELYGRASKSILVYRLTTLSKLANERAAAPGVMLSPSESDSFKGFRVTSYRFSVITLYASIAYDKPRSNGAGAYPITVETKRGAAVFNRVNLNDKNSRSYMVTLPRARGREESDGSLIIQAQPERGRRKRICPLAFRTYYNSRRQALPGKHSIAIRAQRPP
jgi:hypothetical protein